jgi:hypothetical protein
MKSFRLARLFGQIFTRRLSRQLTSVSRDIYKNTLGKHRTAEESIESVIAMNYDASKKIFIGFMGGTPSSWDDTLMICRKVVDRDSNSNRNFLLAQNFVNRLGFQLSIAASPTGDTLNVMLSPGAGISRYLTSKATDTRYHGISDLYDNIR